MTNKQINFGLILFTTLLLSCKKEVDAPEKQDLSVSMLEKVNRLRSKGCKCGSEFMPPVQQLKWNTHLELAAKNHAQDMYDKNYFDHISPTGSIAIKRRL